jgi:ferredoxin
MPAGSEKRDHSACSGCSLCLLVCPSWRHTRDVRMTPHGRAKALQHGATLADIAPSVEACTLCGACEPVCPENIDVVDTLLKLRRRLPQSTIAENLRVRMEAPVPLPAFGPAATDVVLLASVTHKWSYGVVSSIRNALGGADFISVEQDGGADIVLALEIGAPIPDARRERFLAPLRMRKSIIVTDGLLLRYLREWLPNTQCVSVGFALSSLPAVRKRLGAGDLYVIEPRAYHLNHATLVAHYDELRAQTGCTMNLDLQRMAIPARAAGLREHLGERRAFDGEQVRWILKGRNISRIVVESELDRGAFERESVVPVIHAAELAELATALQEASHAPG